MVSIIVRTRNEERWISSCLHAVFEQSFNDFEVIIVDNQSTDGTLVKAKQFPVKIVSISDYKPGKAINEGIRVSRGELLVLLSGHCIPTNPNWLQNLLSQFKRDDIAGVYGRQQPMNFSSPQTKRDLLIVFGLDARIQEKDSFFHNANSAITRNIWDQFPFDETVTNIEDRLWASQVLKNGYKIAYEPKSSVYHYHGIHHDGDQKRSENTIKVIERFAGEEIDHRPGKREVKNLKIAALIPVKGMGPTIKNTPVLQYTLKQATNATSIDKVFVLTDSRECGEYVSKFNIDVPFLRESLYSEDFIDLNTVYQYCLNKIEELGYHPDLIVTLEPTFPFRPLDLIDNMINKIVSEGYDTIIPVRSEFNSSWQMKKGKPERIDGGDIPRHLKDPLFVGLTGLCTVTHSEYMRKGDLFGENIGLMRIDNQLAGIEIRDSEDYLSNLLDLLENQSYQIKI